MSQAITKDTTSERQERVNVQVKTKQPISKKKLAAMKKREMEKLNLTFLKSLNKRMKSREYRKKVDDDEDRFVATIADELKKLPHRERLLAKNDIKNIVFPYQLQILDKQNATQGNFNDQNVSNRNNFVSQLGNQLSLPFKSSHGNSFPIQQSHNQNYDNSRSPEITHRR